MTPSQGGGMKERPILFSGEMVRAILDGRKTQTRRIVKVKNAYANSWSYNECEPYWPMAQDKFGDYNKVPCPYGQIGDKIWVKETFAYVQCEDTDEGAFGIGENNIYPLDDFDFEYYNVRYRATYEPKENDYWGWRPSIHMPRWASRITLEITDIRVERVQDISEEDCLREGIQVSEHLKKIASDSRIKELVIDTFHGLWDSVYSKGAWERNDLVWVITFKRLN